MLYCHSGEGLKLQMMRANPSVCFEVDRHENLANWQSVIAQGTFDLARPSWTCRW